VRRIRSLLAVLALAVGIGAIAGPFAGSADRAKAGCTTPDCIEIYYVIDLVWPGPEPCMCPYLAIDYLRDPRVNVVVAIDFTTQETLPADLQHQYLGQVALGLDLLGSAAAAPDGRVAARLHDRAHDAFLTAARLLGRSGVSMDGVGEVNLARRTVEPAPLPWVAAAGYELASGLNLLVRGLAAGDPHPWSEAAAAHFDAAYADLTGKEVGL
jgi:hypothetical protein